jgi:hypothetical protein
MKPKQKVEVPSCFSIARHSEAVRKQPSVNTIAAVNGFHWLVDYLRRLLLLISTTLYQGNVGFNFGFSSIK